MFFVGADDPVRPWAGIQLCIKAAKKLFMVDHHAAGAIPSEDEKLLLVSVGNGPCAVPMLKD